MAWMESLRAFAPVISALASIIALAISTIALIENVEQTRRANDEHLFDKRFDIWETISSLIGCYRTFSKEHSFSTAQMPWFLDEFNTESNYDFQILAGNKQFQEVKDLPDNLSNQEKITQFLIRVDDLKRIDSLFSYLFAQSDQTNALIQEFLNLYAELMYKMYGYLRIIGIVNAKKIELTEDSSYVSKEKQLKKSILELTTKLDECCINIGKQNIDKTIAKTININFK